MRDFMRQDTRQLGLITCGQDQAMVHADEPARQCEGVDAVVAHPEEIEALCRIAGGLGHQSRTQCLQVFGGLRVFEDLAFVAQLADHLQADAVFLVQRQGG